MAVGALDQLREIIAADADCKLKAEEYDWYYTTDTAAIEKLAALVGNGHCVPLVQTYSGAPTTSLWIKGPIVKGNAKIPAGAGIATFNDKGVYANTSTGNHAALLVSQSAEGLVVVDQWIRKDPAKPSRRTIRFRNGSGSASNDGSRFSLILTRKVINSAMKANTLWLTTYA